MRQLRFFGVVLCKSMLAIALVVFLGSSVTAMACDICGCGVGSNYIGILPDFQKRILGLRYRYSALRTHLGSDGSTSYLTQSEGFYTMELWGGWNITPKWRLMATLPLSFNQRTQQKNTTSQFGLGDLSFVGYYQLLNHRQSIFQHTLLVQTLWVGAGVKLPTGRYNTSDENLRSNAINFFQLGTGSVDFNLMMMYDIRWQDVGISLVSNYKINTANSNHYRYGNKWGANAQAYYKWRVLNKMTVAPNAGVQYEWAGKDRNQGLEVFLSGGNVWFGTVGLEVTLGRATLGGNVQIPLTQSLANGFARAETKYMLHLAIAF